MYQKHISWQSPLFFFSSKFDVSLYHDESDLLHEIQIHAIRPRNIFEIPRSSVRTSTDIRSRNLFLISFQWRQSWISTIPLNISTTSKKKKKISYGSRKRSWSCRRGRRNGQHDCSPLILQQNSVVKRNASMDASHCPYLNEHERLATLASSPQQNMLKVLPLLQDFLKFNDQCDRKQSVIDLLDPCSPSGFSIVEGYYPICWKGLTTLFGVSNCLLQTVQQTPNARHRPTAKRPSRIGIASALADK